MKILYPHPPRAIQGHPPAPGTPSPCGQWS